MHTFKIEVTKFTLVGIANFAFTFVVFTAMMKVWGINYLFSLLVAWIVGMIFSYVMNFTWVFKPEQKIQFKTRFTKFFISSVLSIILNMLALNAIVEHTKFDPFYIQFGLIPFIVIFNFSTAKFWSLRPSENLERTGHSILEIQEHNKNGIMFEMLGKIEGFSKVSIQVCAALVIIYCIWTLDRGFEITDEAYYLLLAMHSGSAKLFISAQQWITTGLWQVTGSLATFRAAGMVVLLASSALLAQGVFSACLHLGLLDDRFESKSVVFAGSAVGALLYASTINLSPCYNLLASAGAYASAGLVLSACHVSNLLRKYALFIIAAFALSIELLCKASAGIATLMLIIFWVVNFELNRSNKILAVVTIISGTVIFSAITLHINTTMSEAKQAIEQGLQLFRIVQVESIELRLLRYCKEFFGYIGVALKAFAFPLLAIVLYKATRRMIFARISLIVLVVTLIFGSLSNKLPTFSIDNALFDSYLFGGFNRFDLQMVAIFSILSMGLIVAYDIWKRDWSTCALVVGLILLPYTVAIGTGNVLFTQVIDSLAPWGILVTVFMIAQKPDSSNRVLSSLIGVCFVTTIALQIVTSGFRPYHLSLPLTKQDQTAVVGNLGKLKVDAGTHKFLTEMKSIVDKCDIKPSSPYLGLYNIPGVALALQAIPVLTPWLNNSKQAEFVIKRLIPEEMVSAIVALQITENEDFPPLPQQLAGFPLGYNYCGMTTYPYLQQKIQIWQSQGQ